VCSLQRGPRRPQSSRSPTGHHIYLESFRLTDYYFSWMNLSFKSQWCGFIVFRFFNCIAVLLGHQLRKETETKPSLQIPLSPRHPTVWLIKFKLHLSIITDESCPFQAHLCTPFVSQRKSFHTSTRPQKTTLTIILML